MLAKRKHLPASWFFVFFVLNVVVVADSPATTSAPATAPASQPATKNLDKALQDEVSFDYNNAWLTDVVDGFRDTTQTNIVVNWPALALTGITRQTPITLHLNKVTYEQAIRALIEQLPTTKSRANYLVGDNALEITTNAELGKHAFPKIFPCGKLLALSADGKPTPEQHAAHAEFLKKIIHAELQRADEDPDKAGKELYFKDDILVATQSRRGLMYIQQVLWRFNAPVHIGQQPEGTVLSVQGKKAEARMTELAANLANLAKDPAKLAPDLNIVLLPNTTDAPELDYTVTEAGVVLIGPAPDIRSRVMLVVYDMKDLLKRMSFKAKQKPAPTNAQLADSVVTQLQTKVPAGRYKNAAWGELDKAPSAMATYENLLVVSGPPALHRAITAALQDLYR